MVLYLVATPIGNLSDISGRALDTLRTCDLILCEDTRHSQILLKHYDISKPLRSYHKFNEAEREEGLLTELKENKSIALISDAGTPGIADPGARLVERCVVEGIEVIAIPGACALITALCCSGLATDRFQFVGFLPRKEGELRKALMEYLEYSGTTICYESPHRLLDLLKQLKSMTPDRLLVVARELTKRFEEVRRGVADDLLTHWQTHEVKGELVVLISGKPDTVEDFASLTAEEHVAIIQQQYSLTRQEAIKLVAKQRGLPKRVLYNSLERSSESDAD